MSELVQSVYSQIVIMSLLGSTEGTYFKEDNGVFHDIRTTAVVSIGDSGLSFGLMQNDVANNAAAFDLFEDLLSDAVTNSRITSLQAADFLSRAATQGLRGSVDDFTLMEKETIRTAVLEPGKEDIERLDAEQASVVLHQVDVAIDAIRTHWNDSGVFDPHDPDYLMAVGYLASWANRTGNINTMQDWLTGASVGSVPTALTEAPSLEDITYYLQHQDEFENALDPEDAFATFSDNVHRGMNLLPPLLAPLGQQDVFPDLDPACGLPDFMTGEIQPCFRNAINAGSPLVIDLSSAHTGVTLTTWSASNTDTFFDLNASGFAVQTAWVSGTTGLLARDLNSNGTIDSSAELFGSPTVDGFAKLAALDSNHDLRIDNNDSAWSSLVVWTDDNGDAVTQNGELHSLGSLSIANIDLAGVASSTSTISGNPISHTSKVTFTGGATATIADAWFIHDNTNSYYAGDYILDAETLFMPALRGYGTIPNLTIAMSQDSDLKDLISDFIANVSLASFADAAGLKADIEEILFTWAGVEGVSPTSRGNFFDGQHLAFLEQLVGADFVQLLFQSPNPSPGAVVTLAPAYQTALDMFSADLLVQTAASDLFEGPVTYNVATGEIYGITGLSEAAIAELPDFAPAVGAANNAYWQLLVRFIDSTRGLDNLTSSEVDWLEDAIAETDVNLSLNTIRNIIDPSFPAVNYISGTAGADTLSGTSDRDNISGLGGNDTIHGNGGNDTISGNAGTNVLYGDGGNDTIFGGADNDTIYGGDGDDSIYGDAGSNTISGGSGSNVMRAGSSADTYVYGGGQDLLIDSGGTDSIILPSGITSGDLTFSRVSTGGSHAYFNDLLIMIEGYGSIQIQDNFSSTVLGGGNIESITFSDASTLNLTTVTHPDYFLTEGNDSISSNLVGNFNIYGGDGNDSIYAAQSGTHRLDGGNGNDTLRGGGGSDYFVASHGLDVIQENGGSDTVVVPEGFDSDDVTFYRVNNASGPTNDLGILIAGLGELLIQGQFQNSSLVVEYLHFDEDNTTIALNSISVATLGTAGNDNLYVPSMSTNLNDYIDGREGNDYLAGGAGNDKYVFSAGTDRIYDSAGDDTILIRDSYTPGDIAIAWNYAPANYSDNRGMILTDSDGNTLIVQEQSYFTTYSVEHIKFADGTIWNLNSIELELYGTSGNDGLEGRNIGDASSADTIYGLGGNDTINGRDGNDLIYGGDGDDYLLGNAGNDTLYGGNGADTIYAASNDGNDVMHGDAGGDTLKGADHCVLYGDDGNDQLWNIATSSYAAGTLVTMYGGNGADTLYAYYGQNIMNGGAGADTLNGSANGVDTFLFDAATAFDAVDTMTGFQKTGTNHDMIDISDVLDGHYNPLTDVITNFVQITTNGSNSELYVDTTGSATFGTSQHIATIQSVTGLTDEAALVTAGLLVAA